MPFAGRKIRKWKMKTVWYISYFFSDSDSAISSNQLRKKCPTRPSL
jgi:hypothetical protein